MILRNVAGQTFGFRLIKRADGTAFPGANPAVLRSLDGGVQAPITGTIRDEGGGQYVVVMSAADCNAASVSFLMTATGAVPEEKTILPFDALSPPPSLVGPPGPPGPPGATGATGATGPPATFLGSWSGGTTYAIGEAVSFGGSSYVSLTAGNIGNQPDVSPTQWAVLAAKGATGAPASIGSPIPGASGKGVIFTDATGNAQELIGTAGSVLIWDVSGLPSAPHTSGDAVIDNAGNIALSSFLTPATAGDASHTVTVTVDAKGRVTALSEQQVTTAAPFVDYAPLVASDWGGSAFMTVQDALDRLAAWISANFPLLPPP